MAPDGTEKGRKVAKTKTVSKTTSTAKATISDMLEPGETKVTVDIKSHEDIAGSSTKKPKTRAPDVEEEISYAAEAASKKKPGRSSKKSQVDTGDDLKPSKEDGHLITTAKTHPGGDMVEVEPAQTGERKSSRKSKGKKHIEQVDEELEMETVRVLVEVDVPVSSASKAPKASKRKGLSKHVDQSEVDVIVEEGPTEKKGRPKGKSAGSPVDVDEVPAKAVKKPTAKSSETTLRKDKEAQVEREAPNKSVKLSEKSKGDVKSAPKPEASGSKKRKPPTDRDSEEIKHHSEHVAGPSSSKKKHKKAQPTTAEGTAESINETVESTKQTAGEEAETVKNYAGDLIGAVQEESWSRTTEAAETVQEKAADGRYFLDDLLESAQKDAKPKIAEAVDAVTDTAATTNESISGLAKSTKRRSKSKATDATEAATEGVAAAKARAGDVAEKAQKQVKSKVSELAELAEPIAQGASLAKKRAGELAEGTRKKSKAKFAEISEATTGGTSTAAENLVGLATDVQKNSKAKAKGVADAVVQGVDNGKEILSSLAEEVQKKSNAAVSSIAEAAAETAAAAEDLAGNLAEGARKSSRKATSKASEAATSVSAVVKDSATSLVEGAKKGSKRTISQANEAAIQAAAATNDLAEGAKKKSKKAAAETSKAATQAATTAKDTVGSLAEGAKRKSKSKVADAKDVAAQGLGAAEHLLHNIADSIQDAETAAIKAAKDTVGNIYASGAETAKQGVTATKDLLDTIAKGSEASFLGGAAVTASDAVSEKQTRKQKSAKASKKGKGKAVDQGGSETPAFGLGGFEEVGVVPLNEETGLDSDTEGDDDDQTAALIKGFESDGDEEAGEADEEGFQTGQPVPGLPDKKGLSNRLKKVKTDNQEPGVIYVGRIPHGFHEHEMRAYFTQFGTVNHVRLSRSKKTGNSKHYAFVEFASDEVAKIVADTMNNYLMYGHILKVAVIPKEQVNVNLWKGADKRFKVVPWNKLEGRKIALPASRDVWSKRVENERKKRESKAEKMKEIGYEFEGRELKGVDQVPVKKRKAGDAVEENVELEKSLITDMGEGSSTVIVSQKVKTRKVYAGGKKERDGETAGAEAVETVGETAEAKAARTDDVVDKVRAVMQEAEEVVNDGMDAAVAETEPEVAIDAKEQMKATSTEVIERAKKSKKARKAGA